MIGIMIPGLPGKIQSAMIKLIYIDILYPEFWLSDAILFVFGIDLEENLSNDEPVNLQFDEFGFQSK
jgi:hypothetical protein